MNYLAHLVLASYHPQSDTVFDAANVFGDFLKGPLVAYHGVLPTAFLAGVTLHRHIDQFMDDDPSTLALQQLFSDTYRRTSGIALDVLYDHFLLKHWSELSLPLTHQTFIQQSYQMLQTTAEQLSLTNAPDNFIERCTTLATRLPAFDVLNRYQHLEGVLTALERIGERFKTRNLLTGIETDLRRIYPDAEAAFLRYWPTATDFAQHTSVEISS